MATDDRAAAPPDKCTDPDASHLLDRLTEVYDDAFEHLDRRGLDQFAAAEPEARRAFRQRLRDEGALPA